MQVPHEYENIKKQLEQSEETWEFLNEKFTSENLYNWMQGELSRLYYAYYKFAFDTAKKAEQTMRHELMRPELDEMNFIKFNYWNGGRKGLLSGEGLQRDLKRMEMAYHDHNKREYELTKHVSLRQLNPLSLLTFKSTGTCEVTVPEWLFDMDAPGHYMRRLKNVSISIPCVVGPYTSINCTLTLLKSSLRKSPNLLDDVDDGEYTRRSDEDQRFIDYYSSIQSIVTSNAQNDSGLFETNLRDERFLPFEGHGVISTWRLELPEEFRQFDYKTISDVILHFRYTSRSGGTSFSEKSIDSIKSLIKTDKSELITLVDLKQDFSNEWHTFENSSTATNFEAKLRFDHFPYFVQSREIEITNLGVLLIENNELTTSGIEKHGTLTTDDPEMTITLPDDKLVKSTDVQNFLVLTYKIIG